MNRSSIQHANIRSKSTVITGKLSGMTFVFIERQIIDWYIAYVNPDDDHWLVFRTIFLSRVCNFDVLLRFFLHGTVSNTNLILPFCIVCQFV